MGPRDTVGKIYKEDHYTLLHTYESSGPCGFGEDFFMFSHCKAMEDNEPRGGDIFDPRGMIGRIYVEHHITLLHTRVFLQSFNSGDQCPTLCKLLIMWFQTSRSEGFGEEDFFYGFPIVRLWKLMTPEEGPFFTTGA